MKNTKIKNTCSAIDNEGRDEYWQNHRGNISTKFLSCRKCVTIKNASNMGGGWRGWLEVEESRERINGDGKIK